MESLVRVFLQCCLQLEYYIEAAIGYASGWVPDLMVFNNIGYYSNPTLKDLNLFSVEQFVPGDDPSKPASRCLVFPQGLGPGLSGPLLTIHVSTLGLTPPFALHFQ